MAKIHKLDNTADYYYDKGVNFSNNGEYTRAIDCFYRALRIDSSEEKYDIFIEIAACYAMLGEHNSALRFYYKALAFNAKNEDAFVGIISSLIALNKNPEAIYYIDYSNAKNIIGDDYDVSVSHSTDKFKVVGKYDREASIYIARRLMKNGEYEYAKSILEEVPPQSKDYVEALNLIAMIYLGQEKFLQAGLVCDGVLERSPQNVYALTSKIVAMHYLNDFAKRDEYAERLDRVEVKGEQDIRKVAVCMQQIKNHALTLKYYKKLLDFSPNDKATNLILAILYHNEGKHSAAHSIMVKLTKLYPDCQIINFYAREFSGENDTVYEVSIDIPTAVQEKRFNFLNEKLTSLKTVERVINYCKKNEDFYDLLRWILWSPQVKIAGHIANFLAQNKYFHPLLREMLVDPDVNYLPKRECLATFLEYAPKKNFALFLQDVVQFFKPRQPKFKVDSRINTAYWQVYSLCVFLSAEDFEKKINEKYRRFAIVANKILMEGVDVDSQTLAVLFANKTQIHPLFADVKYLCKLIDADHNKYSKILDIYNILEDKNV